MTMPLSIYIHVPFCLTKCTYCAFNTYTKLEHLIEPFVDALIHEIDIVGLSKPGQTVHTIFFGGGTPSLLIPEQIERILAALAHHYHITPDAEITLEANPNDLNRPYLTRLHEIGVNRLSIGIQSTHDHELKLFARRHTNDDIAGAVSSARLAGFNSLNLDLIYGAPYQTLESWEWTLKQVLALKPDHLSLYALGLEEGTPMRDWVAQGRLPSPDDDLTADMYELATDVLAAAGFEQYEISNWAKPGHASRHNLQYWRNDEYIGLGPGAHGYAGGFRYWTILAPQKYIQAMQAAHPDGYEYPRTPATDEATLVDRPNEISETLIMGLRLLEHGIGWQSFQDRFGEDLRAIHGPVIDRFVGYELLETNSNGVRLTRKGRLLSNAIFRELV
jgi:oxygen-independent coproporphyrinogen-3 oxidase